MKRIFLALLLTGGLFAQNQAIDDRAHTFSKPIVFGNTVNFTGNTTHSGTETFNGSVTFNGTVTIGGTAGSAALTNAANTFSQQQTGHFCNSVGIDVTCSPYSADSTGATDSSTAFQAAVTAAGNGTDIKVPFGLYQACGISFTNAASISGVGRTGWGASYSSEPVRIACPTVGATVLSQISASGVSGLGGEYRHLVLKDSSNAGVGGGTGSIGLHIKNVNRWRAEDINVQDFSAGTAFLLDFNGATNDDDSYWTLDQPFCRNDLICIHTQGGGSAATIRGGEVGGMPTNGKCFWFEYNANFPDTTYLLDNTSCELSDDSTIVGAQVETGNNRLVGRFEGQSTKNNDAGVRLASTAHNNQVDSEFSKLNIAVDVQPGALANEVDLTRVTNSKLPVRDLGDGTLVVQPNKQWVINALNGGIRSAAGFRFQRDSQGNTTLTQLLGSGVTRMMDSRLDVPCVSLARVSNVVTCTLPSYLSSSPFAVASNVTFEGASSSTFNISTAAVTAIGTSPATVSWAQVASDETALGGHVYMTGGTGVSVPNSNSYILCAGGHGNSLSAIIADDPVVTCMRVSNGAVTFTADTGKTIGSSVSTTTVASLSSAGKFTANGGAQIGTNGTALTAVITGSATLTFTAIAAQTCQEQTIAVTNASTTNFGVNASPRATLGNTNLAWQSWVSASGTVSVRVCNVTTGSITPSAVVWGATVTQ